MGGVHVANEVITSRQNRLVKLVCSLERKKAREESGLFRFDGIKLCIEALAKGIELEYIFVCESRLSDIRGRIPGEAELVVVSDDVFSKMSEEKAPEGVISVAKMPRELHREVYADGDGEDFLPCEGEKVFVLEAIRDPGNLGTIVRTAASLGIDRIVMTSDCTDIYNPKTIRGAMGALFRMPIVFFDDITEAVKILQGAGRRVFAAALDPHAIRFGKEPMKKGDCVVIGNEGHGLSENTVRACGQSLYIPMEEGSESLNAAIAASVLLWGLYNT